jgi:hypothetical protein
MLKGQAKMYQYRYAKIESIFVHFFRVEPSGGKYYNYPETFLLQYRDFQTTVMGN